MSPRKASIFSIIIGLLISPLLVAYTISSDGHIETFTLKALLWLGCIAFILTGFFLWFRRLKSIELLGNLLFSITVFLVLFYGSIGVDRLYGKAFARERISLLYPPRSSAIHQTSEFSIKVDINSIGIRDKEVSLDKKGKKRVLVIGDSFTFGWGVDLKKCWVKLIEQELQKSNPNIEVINLGQGGASPKDYVLNAVKAIPILKPDLVLVGLLSGNDMAQLAYSPPPNLIRNQARQETKETLPEFIIRIGKNLYPNLTGNLSRRNININENWQKEAKYLERMMAENQEKWLQQLDAEVRDMLFSGNLNPALVQDAAVFPSYFIDVLDTNKTTTQKAMDALSTHLATIDSLCEASSSELKILCIPNRPYVCMNDLKYLGRLGFSVPDSLLVTQPDQAIELVCHKLNLQYHSFTEEFRKKCNHTSLYYEWDGHFNEEGNSFLAGLVLEKVFDRETIDQLIAIKAKGTSTTSSKALPSSN